MSIEHSSVLEHPRSEVFAWHARPGAMTRLVPPGQPMTVVSEAESLADGVAVLGLPGGLRWVAQHDPSGFVPGHRFVDKLTSAGPRSWPARVIGWWRHTHEFSEAGTGKTLMRDRVDTPVPAAVLRSMFVFRHRRLAADLDAHRVAAENGIIGLTVAITGSMGPVRSALAAFLTTGGHAVVDVPDGADAVIHVDDASSRSDIDDLVYAYHRTLWS